MACCGSYGTPFVQTKFMGASIASINLQAGWNNSDGGFTVELVEDKCSADGALYFSGGNSAWSLDGDKFDPPPVGSPVYLTLWGLRSGGILKTWYESDSVGDARHYVVKVGSPADIVNGVQCILSGYDGSINGVPNLFNLHGYLIEQTQPFEGSNCDGQIYNYKYPPYGMSGDSGTLLPPYYKPAVGWGKVSDAGWRVNSLLNAISHISTGFGDRFGSRIKYRGYEYDIDLSELPVVSDEIRLNGENKTLMEIIQFICELTGHTFFFDLLYNGIRPVIKLRTGTSGQDDSAKFVDSFVGQPIGQRLNYGRIGYMIGNSTCITKYTRGLELRNCVVNAFVTGDYRQDMWQVSVEDGLKCNGNDYIWPYWGKDYDGKVIVAQECTEDHTFDLKDEEGLSKMHHFEIDIRHLGIDGVTKWNVTVNELRAAIVNESSWRAYLEHYEKKKFEKIHGLSELTLDEDFGKLILEAIDNANAPPDKTKKTVVKPTMAFRRNTPPDKTQFLEKWWEATSRLYDYVRKFATEFYGRQFMVRLPVCAGEDENAPWSYSLNWKESDAAWAEGSILGKSRTSDIVSFFNKEDGRVEGFARFVAPNGYGLLIDGLNSTDYWISSAREIYVRIHAKEIVRVKANDWRVVITTSGPVRISKDDEKILPEWIMMFALAKKATDNNKNVTWENFSKAIVNSTGCDKLALGADFLYLMPVAVAVPLQSNKLVYGPWGTPNPTTNGGTDYQRSTELTPWTFGNTRQMNIAASLMVYARMSDKYVEEYGDVTFPGVPYGRLGDRLVAGGPIISSIDVSISKGDGEVSTTYKMKTWTPDFGKMAMTRIENMRRTSMLAQKSEFMQKSASLAREKYKIDRDMTPGMIDWRKARRHSGTSSHDWIGAEVGKSHRGGDGKWSTSNVAWYDYRQGDVSSYPDPNKDSDNSTYQTRAGMELTGLFRPFSTNWNEKEVGSPFMPHYDKCDLNSYNNILLNTDGGSGDIDSGRGTTEVRFYSHEQVPPIFCYEHHLPITVNTLSPFLGNGGRILEVGNGGWEETGPSMTDDNSGAAGHDIEFILRNNVFPTKLNIIDAEGEDGYDSSTSHWYKAVAFRGPMILSGWGFDIDNKPVPNSNPKDPNEWTENSGPTNYFAEDWLRKSHLWKTGPIDLRWDYNRKVWTSPTPFKLVQVKINDWLLPYGCSPAILTDDMVQFNKDGQAIKTVGGCKEHGRGYPITLNNKTRKFAMPGTEITAYYDTTKKEYIAINIPEFPLVEAIMDNHMDVNCPGKAKAVNIVGNSLVNSLYGGCNNNYNEDETANNEENLNIDSFIQYNLGDPCESLKDIPIEIMNSFKQPICKGTKVLIYITSISQNTDNLSNDKFPSIYSCENSCRTIKELGGVVIRSEFKTQDLITSIKLIEIKSTCKIKSTGDSSEASFTPSGKITYENNNEEDNNNITATFKDCPPLKLENGKVNIPKYKIDNKDLTLSTTLTTNDGKVSGKVSGLKIGGYIDVSGLKGSIDKGDKNDANTKFDLDLSGVKFKSNAEYYISSEHFAHIHQIKDIKLPNYSFDICGCLQNLSLDMNLISDIKGINQAINGQYTGYAGGHDNIQEGPFRFSPDYTTTDNTIVIVYPNTGCGIDIHHGHTTSHKESCSESYQCCCDIVDLPSTRRNLSAYECNFSEQHPGHNHGFTYGWQTYYGGGANDHQHSLPNIDAVIKRDTLFKLQITDCSHVVNSIDDPTGCTVYPNNRTIAIGYTEGVTSDTDGDVPVSLTNGTGSITVDNSQSIGGNQKINQGTVDLKDLKIKLDSEQRITDLTSLNVTGPIDITNATISLPIHENKINIYGLKLEKDGKETDSVDVEGGTINLNEKEFSFEFNNNSGSFNFAGDSCTLKFEINASSENNMTFYKYKMCICSKTVYFEGNIGQTYCSIDGMPQIPEGQYNPFDSKKTCFDAGKEPDPTWVDPKEIIGCKDKAEAEEKKTDNQEKNCTINIKLTPKVTMNCTNDSSSGGGDSPSSGKDAFSTEPSINLI